VVADQPSRRPPDLEIGWTRLGPSAWGRGLNAEAKLLQLRGAFEELDVQRIEFETDEQNHRSRRALEALPARFEGIMRDWKLLADGRRRSSAVYSILDHEWPAVEDNLLRRIQVACARSNLVRADPPAARESDTARRERHGTHRQAQ